MAKFILLATLFYGSALANTCISTAAASTAVNLSSSWMGCGSSTSIAFDVATNGGQCNGCTMTWSHVMGSGSNGAIYVFITGQTADGVSAVSFNGTAMTLSKKYVTGAGYWLYVYYQLNPTSGSHTVLVTSGNPFWAQSISYTGVSEVAPDSSGTGTGTSIWPYATINTNTAGDTLVGAFISTSSGLTIGTGTTSRVTFSFSVGDVFDTGASNATGVNTVQITSANGSAVTYYAVVIGIAPATYTGGSAPQTGDAVQIASQATLTSSFSVASITINSILGNLVTNGLGPYTVTTTSGVTVTLGCLSIGGGCSTANAIDTSAASAGNEVTWAYTSITSSEYLISKNTNNGVNMTLPHCIFQMGSGNGIQFENGNNTDSLTITNSKFVNGVTGVLLDQNGGSVMTFIFNSNSSTGLAAGSGGLVSLTNSFPATCSINNNTMMSASSTTNTAMVTQSGSANDISACGFTGNALLGDSSGTYLIGLFYGLGNTAAANAQVFSYNLMRSYFSAFNSAAPETMDGLGGCSSSSGHHCLFLDNVIDGANSNYDMHGWNDSQGNVSLNGGTGQGSYFYQLTSGVLTSTNDIAASSTIQGSGVYGIGGSTPPCTTPTSMAVLNMTAIMPVNTNGTETIGFGEGSAGSGFNVCNSSVFFSIAYGGDVGIIAGNPDDTFVTSGMGGVGIAQNNVYGATTAYFKQSPATNFDNGTNAHPNAIYGDLSLNPMFFSTYRPWTTCDQILGGPGTEADLFTQLFNRWNGTNAVNFTPQIIYNCMRAPYAPQEVRLAGVGALTPRLIFTSVQ